MTGMPYLVRLMGYGLRRPKNPVPGLDVAGRVVAVGDNVARFQVGDEVFGIAGGSYAEYAIAEESKLAHKPANVTFEQAGVAAISGITAGTGIRRIKNPHYDLDDTRVEVAAGVFKRAGPVQIDFGVDWQRVDFDEASDDLLNLGVAVKLDTRQEAYLPRNAVYLGAGYDRLDILDSDRQDG